MTEKVILRGTLEDHLGNPLHPATDAQQVKAADGKTVETKLSELLAELAKYLPLGGGTVAGEFGVDNTKGINIGAWGQVSAGSDGHVLIGQNCYKHKGDNSYRFANDHSSMGAKGVVLQLGVPGVYVFDTGSMPTTAGAAFSPTLHKLLTTQGGDISGIRVHGNAGALALVGNDHVFMELYRNGQAGGRSGYIGFPGVASPNIEVNNSLPGGSVSVSSAVGLTVNGHRVPRIIQSPNAPNATDGQDGDVWQQYV